MSDSPEIPVLYSGNSYRYKIILTTSDVKQTPTLEKIQFDIIDSNFQKSSSFLPNIIGSASATTSITSRAAWGCPDPDGTLLINDENRYWPPVYSAVRKSIVHHTVTYNTDPIADIRAIWNYHTYTKTWYDSEGVLHLGFGDIGYNYLIDRNGQVYEGRYGNVVAPEKTGVVAGHAAPFNVGSMGVAVLGDYSSVSPTSSTQSSLAQFLGEKSFEYGFDPAAGGLFDSTSDPIITVSTGNIDGHKHTHQLPAPAQSFMFYLILGQRPSTFLINLCLLMQRFILLPLL